MDTICSSSFGIGITLSGTVYHITIHILKVIVYAALRNYTVSNKTYRQQIYIFSIKSKTSTL